MSILNSPDGYKHGHKAMYQPKTELIYSNFTPRSDRLFKGSFLYDNKLVVFGIQGAMLYVRSEFDEFFRLPKAEAVRRYQRRVDFYLGAGVVDTQHIEALHELGYLPIRVKALPEGTRVGMKVPVLTIVNTDAKFAWLVNYLETVLSNLLWKPMTNATIAYEYRRVFEYFAEKTGTPKELVKFQGHDFSARGMSGPEDAARSNAGHLLSFVGTDTVSTIDYLEDNYLANVEKELVGCSVPATEHSVSSSNILFYERALETQACGEDPRLVAERMFMERYITEIVPSGIASYVADTYDFWGVITDVVPSLKDVIMARHGKLVVRPDSGDPVEIICGTVEGHYATIEAAVGAINNLHYSLAESACEGAYCMGNDVYESVVCVGGKYFKLSTRFEYNRHDKTYYYVDNYGDAGETKYEEVEATPEMKGAIQCLWETFGGTITDKGYKLLDEHIGLIYGDSITLERQRQILERLAAAGFASGNVVLGIGSYTYNYSTRDTFGFAMKATATVVDGELIPLFKDPATASNKKSAKGLLNVERVDGGYVLNDNVTWEQEAAGELRTVFEDGMLVDITSLAEIRERLVGEI